VSDSVDQEIGVLQSLYRSEHDPDGLAFAPLADAFLRKGDLRDALELLSDGRVKHPDFSTGHVIAARLYYQQGMAAEAEFAARRVLELDAENIVALSLLGSVLDERGDEEAVAVRAALVEVDPESDEARSVSDPKSDVVDAAADVTSHEYGDVDHDGPTEELLAIGQDDDRGNSFEDALGLAEADPSGETESEVQEDELSAALDMRGLAELAASVDEPVVEDVMDLGALAPDPEPESVIEDVMDLGALAPDPEPEPVIEKVMDLGALAPDSDVLAAAAMEPADPSEEDPHMHSSEPVYTRTLAELYVSQGFTDKALDVYRLLSAVEPDAEDLSPRIAELEGGPIGTVDPVIPSEGGAPKATEEEVETLARDLAEVGSDDHEVDTPFAWSEDAAADVSSAEKEGSTIGGYFDQLLSWGERET